MGIGPGWFNFFLDLCRAGDLKQGDAMLDIGASELFCEENPQSINDFLDFFGAPRYPEKELLRMADRAFAADLFRRAGFPYAALDYANFPEIIRLDLNTDSLPRRHRRRYRFVANSGTSEHILNQYNVFQVVHDAASEGAIMYHGVPGWGDYEHGIIGYSPKFFWALATANDYQIVKYWGWADSQVVPLKPEFMEQIAFPRAPMCERVWLHILLRKVNNRPFRGLNDPSFRAEATMPLRG